VEQSQIFVRNFGFKFALDNEFDNYVVLSHISYSLRMAEQTGSKSSGLCWVPSTPRDVSLRLHERLMDWVAMTKFSPAISFANLNVFRIYSRPEP
jgi:hypothetical protein